MSATFAVYVDWDGDKGQTALGSFETPDNTSGWLPYGSVPPAIARSTTRAHLGSASLRVTWGAGGTLPAIGYVNHGGLTVGVSYTFAAWVYVPAGSVGVALVVGGIGFGTGSASNDTWERITFTFTATATAHGLFVWPTSAPAGGEQFWFDEPTIYITGEDVTARVLDRSGITVQYGRDQARALSPIAPGRAGFELDNTSRDYSPENGSSPLVGNILPARPFVVKATLGQASYALLSGQIDEYDVLPNLADRSVQVTGLGSLARFKDQQVTTMVYEGLRTGDAISVILDAVGWPDEWRDIDPGATTIRWYWEERTDAFAALERIVNSEGPGAFVAVDGDGRFIFRDRHHRLLRSESVTSQATFRDTGAEPKFSPPLVYDHGWRDIINSVTIQTEERHPASERTDVFSSDRIYSIADGDTLVIQAGASEPFYGAVTPEAVTDYTLVSGAVVITMWKTSGQSTTVYVRATGGPAIVDGMRVRAYPLQVVRSIQTHKEESSSISKYGRRSYSQDAPWAGVNDADAIAGLILAHYAERLPIVSLRMVGSNSTRQTQMLARRVSDRVTIVDAESGLNSDFYVDRVEHQISEAGLHHEVTFGCEKVQTAPTDLFRFDVAGAGFNDGKFAAEGLDDPDTIFLFDSATQGFNDGLFAH